MSLPTSKPSDTQTQVVATMARRSGVLSSRRIQLTSACRKTELEQLVREFQTMRLRLDQMIAQQARQTTEYSDLKQRMAVVWTRIQSFQEVETATDYVAPLESQSSEPEVLEAPPPLNLGVQDEPHMWLFRLVESWQHDFGDFVRGLQGPIATKRL